MAGPKKPAAPRPRRSYSAEQKAKAIGLFQEHGVREAARLTNIPRTTIGAWAARAGIRTDAPAKTAAATDAAAAKRLMLREQLRTAFLEKAVDLMGRMDEPHVEVKVVSDPKESEGAGGGAHVELVEIPRPTPSGVRDYAVAVGILLDKFRLEMGENTERKQFDLGLGNVSGEDLDVSIAAFVAAHIKRGGGSQPR